jgi:hypothetical protein
MEPRSTTISIWGSMELFEVKKGSSCSKRLGTIALRHSGIVRSYSWQTVKMLAIKTGVSLESAFQFTRLSKFHLYKLKLCMSLTRFCSKISLVYLEGQSVHE